MKVRTADGYQDGKAYRVRLIAAEQYADTAYQSTDLVVKVKLVWEGKHGQLSKLFSVPVVDDQPTIRPNLGLSRALMAHGVSWEEVSAGLELRPMSKAHRSAYVNWFDFPSLKDHKAADFQPVRVDVLIGGESLIGGDIIAQVELTKDGLAQVAALSPLPDDDDAPEPSPDADETEPLAGDAGDDGEPDDLAGLKAPARKARR